MSRIENESSVQQIDRRFRGYEIMYLPPQWGEARVLSLFSLWFSMLPWARTFITGCCQAQIKKIDYIHAFPKGGSHASNIRYEAG